MKFLLLFIFAFSLPGLCQEDEDAMVDQLVREKSKELNARKNIVDGIKETFDPLKELKKIGHDEINAATFMDDEAVKIIQKAILEAKLADRSPEMIRAIIMGQIKGSYGENIVHMFPWALDLFVEIMRDREALPALMGLFIRKDDMKIYFYIWLFLFIMSLYWRKRLTQKKWSGFAKGSFHFMWSLGFSALTFGIFYSMFSREVGPSLNVIWNFI